jgi:hypothetical protein
MLFTSLVGFSAFLVAGCAAYFSVIGIAKLFAGSFYQVMIMAGALEFSKLVATSFLYRYWTKTAMWLRVYMLIAVGILMCITSMGVFGYLSSAYQANSVQYTQIDEKVAIIEKQKESLDKEIVQITERMETLNKSRIAQEQRLPSLSSRAAKPIYDDIKSSGQEIKALNTRIQELQNAKLKTDTAIVEFKAQNAGARDIGTFKFIAQCFNVPLDTIVKVFIFILIIVFDPLAVALVLAFNVATKKNEVVPTIVVTPTPKPVVIEIPTITSTYSDAIVTQSSRAPIARKYTLTNDES